MIFDENNQHQNSQKQHKNNFDLTRSKYKQTCRYVALRVMVKEDDEDEE